MAVVTFARWEEGLVIAPGNPKNIHGVEDLQRKNVTLMNREAGSGSRALLDNPVIGGVVMHSRDVTAHRNDGCGAVTPRETRDDPRPRHTRDVRRTEGRHGGREAIRRALLLP